MIVYEQATPALARVGRQGAGARRARSGSQQHRPAGFPAQGVRAKEPATTVVADMDCLACSEGLFEDRPSQGGGGSHGWRGRSCRGRRARKGAAG